MSSISFPIDCKYRHTQVFLLGHLHLRSPTIKGALHSFAEEIQQQNVNIYNINETLIDNKNIYFSCSWINELFLRRK